MIAQRLLVGAVLACAAMAATLVAQPRSRPSRAGGTIVGHVGLQGKAPGNPVIRMGIDPRCADLNRGRQVIQEEALVTRDGSVANVFVRIEGSFPATPVPATPVPATPVVIDQRSCVYAPRVVGVRVGQTLEIRNDDDLLHNVHSLSAGSNSFNVGQPKAGAVFDFRPRAPEVMLKIGCDVHRWMTAYVGVMPHPYFAVTDSSGTFAIPNVPPGRYTFKTWHERFGEQTRIVTVTAGATVRMDVALPAVSTHFR